MNKKFSIKDLMFIALLTAIYVIIYMVTMTIIAPLGSFGHAIAPGVAGLLAGIVLYFMVIKVNRFGQFTFLTLVTLGVFALMGGGYLPWLITSLVTALIADFICTKTGEPTVLKTAIASGIMHVGQAWGAIIPSWFFLNAYRETWISRGQTPEDMDAMIKYTSGLWGLASTIIVFVLAAIGIYIGYSILKKHLRK